VTRPFADHFSGLAPAYAVHRPRYPESLFAWLATLTPRHELAWDCAAGTGQASVGLTPFYRQVVATDASAGQIAAATPHPAVEFRVAPAAASGLDAGSVDLVTVAQALHWIELQTFYPEVERVLGPGGAIAVWTYGIHRIETGIDRAVAEFYTDVVGKYWAPERRHVETGYRDLPFPFAEFPIPRFEMALEWTLEDLLGYVGTWSATARYREVEGRDPIDQLRDRVRPLWGDPRASRLVCWPLSIRAGRRGR